ncbi:MAG TPA: SusC/RagA family TonB-linked outer membrane protein [Chitinophagaceae bacterium]|nr:SusC/RagA family TonB-linked outer membrane protein [Chitinophagaceae bacterium]
MRKFASLLTVLMLLCTLAFAQTRTVTGTVKDDNGQPIPGASVTIKGKKGGTSTDAKGAFKLVVSTGNTLVITAVGYAQREVSVDNSSSFDINLIPQRTDLTEVIVTSVAGATTKANMTVSVTKLNADKLTQVPATSMASALQGKVAGLQMASPQGNPGSEPDIQLRADNNLPNVGSGPLILIDGVILNGSLADINADDVESIEVVKGAAASALYGSRAGNGVIAITTKRGSRLNVNTVAVTVRNEIGFQNLPKELSLATHHQYALASDWQQYQGQYTKYAGVTYPSGYTGAGYSPLISGNQTPDADHYMDNPFGVTNDLQKAIFRTGNNFTNFVSVSSRSEKTNLYTSFENNVQQGIVVFTGGYQRQNFRLNLDQQIAKWLKISTSNLYITTETNQPSDAGSFFNVLLMTPDVNLYQANPDGQPYYLRTEQFLGNNTNPLYDLWKYKPDSKDRHWIGDYSANVKFTSWANLDLNQTIEIEDSRYTLVVPKDTWTFSGGTAATNGEAYTNGSLSQNSSESINKNTQVTLNLTKKFGGLDVKGKLSYLYENAHYEGFNEYASQFQYPDVPVFANFTNITSGGSSITDSRTQDYFAIASLNWKNKYLVDGMFRQDGSSLFGSNARWNSYYRISGAYRITQDIRIPGIDELKIRAAYGTAGIRPGFDWQYEVFLLSNGVATALQEGNNDLKPSNTAETEVGLDANFLKKFSLEAVYASSVTTNQYLNVPLVAFLNNGHSQQWQNAGTVKSNTLELTLGADWVKHKDFSWSTNIVFSRIRQKITSLPIKPYLYGGTDGGGGQMFYIKQGETYGAMYGYDYVRTLDQMSHQLPAGKSISDYEVNSDGFVVAKGTQGTPQEAVIQLKSPDGSLWYGKIGDGNPNFNMGVSNTLKYKGISLYFLIDVKDGGDVYNARSEWITRDNRNGIEDMYGVDPSKKKTYDYFQSIYNVNQINRYWVENAGYIKLREVSLGYSFSNKFLDRTFKGVVKGITAKAIGRNLATITNYSGYDPEVGTLRTPYDGINHYPNFRNIAFSLQFDF